MIDTMVKGVSLGICNKISLEHSTTLGKLSVLNDDTTHDHHRAGCCQQASP